MISMLDSESDVEVAGKLSYVKMIGMVSIFFNDEPAFSHLNA